MSNIQQNQLYALIYAQITAAKPANSSELTALIATIKSVVDNVKTGWQADNL